MEQYWNETAVQLANLLELPDSTDIMQYILSINNKHDVEEYLNSILDEANLKHRKFISQFMSKWSRGKNLVPPAACQIYKKTDVPNETDKKREKRLAEKRNSKKQQKEEPISSKPVNIENDNPKPTSVEVKTVKSNRKLKYAPLFSLEGQSKLVVSLPGRVACECQASKHNLINNCLTCGRIVCGQEGSGPCMFCGNLVCTNEEQEILDRNSNSSHQLYRRLMGRDPDASSSRNYKQEKSDYQKAIDHKNMLLEFDRTVEKRTKVFDDQADYFTVDNRWLSKEERDAVAKRESEVKAKKEADRKVVTVNFDFAGRQIIEDKPSYVLQEHELEKELQKYMHTSGGQENFNPNIIDFPRPIYKPLPDKSRETRKTTSLKNQKGMRLQGHELQEMSDDGWCLSMHQPYASLLISGSKRHEGRIWYTALRGRLWIASTSKSPSLQDVQAIENSYRILKKDENIFPNSYPVGALLGCVTLVDCLSQEEYRQKYPDGESDEPFVFICENPQELIVKFPIKGKHKIYKLDPRIHDAAKKSIKLTS